MSVVAMPPYPSTIPASAFSPTANDDNVWMATPAAAARRYLRSIELFQQLLQPALVRQHNIPCLAAEFPDAGRHP